MSRKARDCSSESTYQIAALSQSRMEINSFKDMRQYSAAQDPEKVVHGPNLGTGE